MSVVIFENIKNGMRYYMRHCESFLTDIYRSEPNKFLEAWNKISSIIEVSERECLEACLNL